MSSNEEMEQEVAEPIREGQELPTVLIDESEDEEKDQVVASTPALSARAQRRAKIQEERDARHRREEERLSRLEAAISALGEARGQAPMNAPPAASHEASAGSLEQIDEQRKLILDRLTTPGLSAEENARLYAQFNRLDRARIKAIAREDQPASAPQQPVDIRSQIERTNLEMEFPQVFGNPDALAAADREYRILMARGMPAGIATARLAGQNILKAMGNNPTSDDSSQRSKYVGTAARPGAPGAAKKVTLTPMQMKIARTYARHLTNDDAKAAEIWVRDVALPNKLL